MSDLRELEDRVETLERLLLSERRARVSDRHRAERISIYGMLGAATLLLVIGSGITYDSQGFKWQLLPETLGILLGTGGAVQAIVAWAADRRETDDR